MSSARGVCTVVDLGRRDYRETWDLQKRLVERRRAGEISDALLFVEHPPTYTLGRNGKREHFLVATRELERLGATFVETNRGGDITFHGPGQLVGYPIVDLKTLKPDVTWYVRGIEEVLIRTLGRFGIESSRVAGRTGVWHSAGKLAAIGIHVSRWITSHGFALNVTTDLRYFEHIVPCGIVDARVTSMEGVLGKRLELETVEGPLTAEWGRVFGHTMLERDALPVGELDGHVAAL